MSLEPAAYTYDFSVISEISRTDQIVGLGILIVGVGLYIGLPRFYRYRENQALLKDKKIKRQAIGDLISMKEIQGEIEKEMRDALIRSELRAKPAEVSVWEPAQAASPAGDQK